MDESGLLTVENEVPKVATTTRKKVVGKVSPEEIREFVCNFCN